MTTLRSARFGLLCAVSATLAFGSVASAEEGVAIKNLLGSIGIIAPEKDPIRYRERAPLVLPPKMQLRAPAGAESYASNNPQWPKDPDVVARTRRAADERVPAMDSQTRRMADNFNTRLTPDELRAGRNPNGPGPGTHKGDRDGVWVNPRELQAVRSSDEPETIGEAPVRRTLTDPPSVLRQYARGGPTRPTFQGKVDQQELDANPINWLTRAFRSDEDE